jgi:hypothetical protein
MGDGQPFSKSDFDKFLGDYDVGPHTVVELLELTKTQLGLGGYSEHTLR